MTSGFMGYGCLFYGLSAGNIRARLLLGTVQGTVIERDLDVPATLEHATTMDLR